MRIIRSFVIAFSTYTRIPMPQVEWSDENRRYAMCFFPLIGAVIGAVMWAWLLLCSTLAIGGLLKGAVAALIPLLITGGIHMDGFMDTTDALASWQPTERRLEILKDTHVGAFAVIGCAAYLLLFAGLLGEAAPQNAPLIGMCFVLSRALSAWALAFFKSARKNGMLDDFARTAQKRRVGISCSIYALLCAAVWFIIGGMTALFCAAGAALCLVYYRCMAYKLFGGVTGDLAGWFVEVTELVLIAIIIFGGKLL